MSDYYSVLGCQPGASIEQIRRQYKKLALQLHPDKQQSEESNSSEQFNLINKAVATLTDEKEKYKYDSLLLAKQNSNKIINDELSLEEFTFDADNQCYVYECRCGGQFVISGEDSKQLETLCLIECNSCSLCILVTR